MDIRHGHAEDARVWAGLPKADLVVTSPPAWPSPDQPLGSMGAESSLSVYMETLRVVLERAMGRVKPRGWVVLVIQPQDQGETMAALQGILERLGMVMRSTHRWSHGNGHYSWVVFLSPYALSPFAKHPAVRSKEWAIPVAPADLSYGFWEWPDGLVDAIVKCTIPRGGVIIDPFCGKAAALSRLPPRYDVYGIDANEKLMDPSASQDGMAVQNTASGADGENRGVA